MMDFSVLVAELRDVAEKYKGKTTEPQVSTVVYVDMFTKVCSFRRESDLHPFALNIILVCHCRAAPCHAHHSLAHILQRRPNYVQRFYLEIAKIPSFSVVATRQYSL